MGEGVIQKPFPKLSYVCDDLFNLFFKWHAYKELGTDIEYTCGIKGLLSLESQALYRKCPLSKLYLCLNLSFPEQLF